MKFVLYGKPRTKKNSTRFVTLRDGRKFLLSSRLYTEFENNCLKQITRGSRKMINKPVSVSIKVYKTDKRKSDLVGYLQSVSDILVKAEVLRDDNYTIIKNYNGSFVDIDKINPRVEITITELSTASPLLPKQKDV